MSRRLSFLLGAALAGACLLPLVLLAALSVTSSWTWPNVFPRAVTLSRWATVAGAGSALGRSLVTSLLVSGASALLATAGGYVAGKYVAAHRRRRELLLLAYVPFVMSPVILGVCLLFVFLETGLAGVLPGVILAHTAFGCGFAVVFFDAFWNPEKRALEDLVRTLGGGSWVLYRRVLLPLSRGAILICLAQTFLISWFQYGLTILIGGGAVQTLSMKVYDYVGEANIHHAAVASCLLIVPPVLLLWLTRRILFRPA